MICPYCNHTVTYTLATGQEKCAKCRRKFSPQKQKQELLLIRSFCENHTINDTSKKLGLNYLTVKKKYELFRKLISNHLEQEYLQKESLEYDEYLYLPKSKKKELKNIFDAQNFLTFKYENKVYNILMPSLERYKSYALNDSVKELYIKEFSKFLNYNKIAKIEQRENTIINFWSYFEENILKYKGINNENFFYYLKEFEFKFNYSKEDTIDILTKLYKAYQKR